MAREKITLHLPRPLLERLDLLVEFAEKAGAPRVDRALAIEQLLERYVTHHLFAIHAKLKGELDAETWNRLTSGLAGLDPDQDGH